MISSWDPCPVAGSRCIMGRWIVGTMVVGGTAQSRREWESMSWSAFVLPLHACPVDVLQWVREIAGTHVSEELPRPRPLPTVEQVLIGLRDAGCCGDAWYTIVGGGDPILPSCRPDSLPDLYLGEVSITVEGAEDRSDPVRLDDRVAGLSFRKPRDGLLRAVAALVVLGGEQVVFDILGEGLVTGADDDEETLGTIWPW